MCKLKLVLFKYCNAKSGYDNSYKVTSSKKNLGVNNCFKLLLFPIQTIKSFVYLRADFLLEKRISKEAYIIYMVQPDRHICFS